MSDALVQTLNRMGYQLILLPRQDVRPPELYFHRRGKLHRYGALSGFSKKIADLLPSQGDVPDIIIKALSNQSAQGTVSFLEGFLTCLGVPSDIGAKLGVLKSAGVLFSVQGVTLKAIDPTILMTKLEGLRRDIVPRSLVENGELHIAYEYLYGEKLTAIAVGSGDSKAEVSARFEELVKIGADVKALAENQVSMTFTSRSGPVAFAYRAGLLEVSDQGDWEFYPEVIKGATAGGEAEDLETGPYLPCMGSVAWVEDELQPPPRG